VSYNGSGTFQINSTGQPVVSGTVISSTAFNALTADLATGLSTAITKDGQTATTARIPFAAGINSSLTTDSTSGTTGSIITAGGIGVAKAVYVGTTATVAGTTDSSSTTTGSIITAGGAGIAKALFVGTTANVAGAVTLQSTLAVGGVATYSAQPIFSSLTASSAVATDASKGLVSVTNTGTGNNVLATSPTLVTPALGTPTALVGTNITGTATAFNINGTVGATTPSTVAATSISASTTLGVTGVATFSAGTAALPAITTTGDTNTGIYFPAADTIAFAEGGAEAMRIDSSGRLLVNSTSAQGAPYRVDIGSNSTTGNSLILKNNGTEALQVTLAGSGLTTVGIGNTTASRIYVYSNVDTATGQYMTSGGTSWNSTSDERLKENLVEIPNAIEKVSALRAVIGNYISDEAKKPTPFLIAQDVQAVFPEAVDASDPDTLGLSYTGMIPVLVKAIQEQQALITALTTRITALEAA